MKQIDQGARAVAGSTRQCTRGPSADIDLGAGDLVIGVPGSGAVGGASNWFVITLNAAGASHAATLTVTGARQGDLITVTSEETTAGIAHTVVNGGPAAGTIGTFTATTKGHFVARFNGTNWEPREYGNGVT